MMRRLSREAAADQGSSLVVYRPTALQNAVVAVYDAPRSQPFAADDERLTTREERLALLASSESMRTRLERSRARVDGAVDATEAEAAGAGDGPDAPEVMPELPTREERLSLLLRSDSVMSRARERRRSSAAGSAGHERRGRDAPSAACVVMWR